MNKKDITMLVIFIVSTISAIAFDERQSYYSPSGSFECVIEIEESTESFNATSFRYYKQNGLYIFYFTEQYYENESITTYSSEPIKFQCWVD